MRIIGGAHRGRGLSAPKGSATRPTSDMVREALFSSLFDVQGWRVLDLFAGTGAVGLEALSRGAAHVTFVEKARPALQSLLGNIEGLRIPESDYTVLRSPVARALAALPEPAGPFDLIFADPPYAQAAQLVEGLVKAAPSLLAEHGLLICEHRSSDPAPTAGPGIEHTKSKRYGEATLSFYELQGSS